MLTRIVCYIKARYRVRKMLQRYPTLKKTVSPREVSSIVRGVAKHLYRNRKNKTRETDNVCTIQEYCSRCKNGDRWDYGKQTICGISNETISKYRTGKCKHFKEDYKKC